jgi:hypothetical protein
LLGRNTEWICRVYHILLEEKSSEKLLAVDRMSAVAWKEQSKGLSTHSACRGAIQTRTSAMRERAGTEGSSEGSFWIMRQGATAAR